MCNTDGYLEILSNFFRLWLYVAEFGNTIANARNRVYKPIVRRWNSVFPMWNTHSRIHRYLCCASHGRHAWNRLKQKVCCVFRSRCCLFFRIWLQHCLHCHAFVIIQCYIANNRMPVAFLLKTVSICFSICSLLRHPSPTYYRNYFANKYFWISVFVVFFVKPDHAFAVITWVIRSSELK